jgi:hypothetical protein
MRGLVASVLLASAACAPEEGPLMAPGQDCIECHDGGEAKRWTAAGTWARGAHVTVTDANGKSVTVRGNKVGNFYTAEPLTPPLTVTVDGARMDTATLKGGFLAYGGCNLCHSNGGVPLADLGLMAAGRDCLQCHRAGGLAASVPFAVAGTFPPGGRTVTIVDANGVSVSRTTNAVGNFYVDVPLQLPLKSATVNGEAMPPEKGLAPNCNSCHGNGEEHDD